MQDFLYIFQWWISFFIVGLIFFPLTQLFFQKFIDRGYIFSKIVGMAIISYSIFLLGSVRLLPFSIYSIFLILILFTIVNFFIFSKQRKKSPFPLRVIIAQELLFFAGIVFWSFVRGHEPSIHGLEKYMDFGFINSILRSTYFPPKDMWFSPLYINYYYFGHLITATLTKMSLLPSNITYNLMLSTIFSFSFLGTFSIIITLLSYAKLKKRSKIIGGLFAGALLSLGGNLHILYSLFRPYNVDSPVPIWKLAFSPMTFPNGYWYPNATRFIPFTIHEFPLYSFVVSDLHGHVLDIPFAIFAIAFVYATFLNKKIDLLRLIFFSFFLAVMYMTNTWDAIIYFLLFVGATSAVGFMQKDKKDRLIKGLLTKSATLIFGVFVFSLPFSIFFKPFVSGFGIICSPKFLVSIGKIGPFLFEKNHCQRSEWWQLLTLHGFFYIVILIFLFLILKKRIKNFPQDIFIFSLIVLSTFLIILPEFIYAKDIYPAHYRANTMFKLVYQAFIMLSISSAYIIARIIHFSKISFFSFFLIFLSSAILVYPYFAVKSYYSDIKTYYGIDGTKYLKTLHPEDYEAINWINQNISGQPVILEAQGDSYTDYARISANTGLPTILGWTVHEWLWRGSYDIPSPRINEIKIMYESSDISETKKLLNKYNVSYVYVGQLEREKYKSTNENKWGIIGSVIFEKNLTRIYKVQ